MAWTQMSLEFTLSNEDEIFDAAPRERPYTFEKDKSKIPSFLMSRLESLNPGQTFSWTLEPELAFGKINKDLRVEIETAKLPDSMKKLSIGDFCEMKGPDKKQRAFRVVSFDENKIILDGNSPLAGQIIYFEGTLLEKF